MLHRAWLRAHIFQHLTHTPHDQNTAFDNNVVVRYASEDKSHFLSSVILPLIHCRGRTYVGSPPSLDGGTSRALARSSVAILMNRDFVGKN